MKRIVGLSIIFALSSTLVMANVTVPELANAIQLGDENKVTQYLAEGGNPNATLVQGQTLVFASVGAMNNKALKQLIDAGGDVNTKYMGVSARQIAKNLGNHDALVLLTPTDIKPVDAGSTHINIKDFSSKTILSQLSPADQIKAKQDAKRGEHLSYPLYEKEKASSPDWLKRWFLVWRKVESV